MKKRLTAILLLVAMLASCSESTSEETAPDTITPVAEIETSAVIETETSDPRDIPDEVPELDFGGASFRSIGQSSANKDISVAELSGEALNDAIYNRNTEVSDRLNVKIELMEEMWYTDLSALVNKSVSSGDDAYDLVLGQMAQSGKDARNGIYHNWHTIPNMDFSKPWYPKSVVNDSATINGKMYNLVSDMLISFASQTWAIVYDKVLAEDYALGNMYDKVYSGEWTLDYLYEITNNIYQDKNANGMRDEKDFYGFTTASKDNCLMAAYVYGSENTYATPQNEQMILTLNSERAVSTFEKLHKLIFESNGTWDTGAANKVSEGKGMSLLLEQFKNGNTIFCNASIGGISSSLRDYENDYGVLPIPKFDEAQEEYYTVTDMGCNVMSVPTTAKQLEMIGAVTECLAAESFRSVLPIYYEITLGTKGIRDENSSAMMDYILESRQIDFAYMYDGTTGLVFNTADYVQNSSSFSSSFSKAEKMMQKYYERLLKFFYED